MAVLRQKVMVLKRIQSADCGTARSSALSENGSHRRG